MLLLRSLRTQVRSVPLYRTILGILLLVRDGSLQKAQKWLTILRFSLHKLLLGEYDLVFVIYEKNRGWILEAISQEIAAYFPGKYCFHYSNHNLPPSKAYFIAHYGLFPLCLQYNPHLAKARSLIWYTHPKDIGISDHQLLEALNQATKVICTCSEFTRSLISQGLPQEKVIYLLGGADPKLFQSHDRKQSTIGFCSAYYPRKSPEKILQIIQQMSHRTFILMGRKWNEYERFSELIALPNLTYVEVPYAEYPKYYAQMDVFVSLSKLEGGPIPLIEAMMCNVVPVASRTGFAPDLIQHGQNGFLFDAESSIEVICELIEQAFLVEVDVRETVEHLSWENFSVGIQTLLTQESS